MTIEIQAPYRLLLAQSPQQVMALQAYIQAAYTLEFNARIPHFLPCLLGLYRADGVLVGACGLNHASTGEREQPLYLEQYLEQPIEAAIETRLGVRPARSRIIEVGNLACSEPGNARLMFAALCRLLCDNALDYVVFTGTAYTATVDTTFTWNGETHSLNLVARVNAQDGKTYYALDANGDGVHNGRDSVSHDWLDGLLNGGADTVDTQSGGAVKGVDDARTVIINGNTWVLPTLAELNALYNDSTVANPPAGWGSGVFWSSTQFGSGAHGIENVVNGNQVGAYDTNIYYVAFQVL